jgi:hypothetical protein
MGSLRRSAGYSTRTSSETSEALADASSNG